MDSTDEQKKTYFIQTTPWTGGDADHDRSGMVVFVPFNQTGFIPSGLDRIGLGDDISIGVFQAGLAALEIGVKPVTDEFGVRKFFEDLMSDDRLSHHENFIFFVLVKLSGFWTSTVLNQPGTLPCNGNEFWKHGMAAHNVLSELRDIARGKGPADGLFTRVWHKVIGPKDDKPPMDEMTQERLRTNLATFVTKAYELLDQRKAIPECGTAYLGSMVKKFYADGAPEFTDRQQRALLKLATVVSLGADIDKVPASCRADFTCFMAWLYDRFYKPSSEPRPRLYINQQSSVKHIDELVSYLKEVEKGVSAPDFWERVAAQVDCFELRADMEGDDWLVVLALQYMNARFGTKVVMSICYHPGLIADNSIELLLVRNVLDAHPIPEPLANKEKQQYMLNIAGTWAGALTKVRARGEAARVA